MQENKIVKRIPTNLVTKTIITSSAEYESNREYTDEDANIYEKYLQAITNVSIGINDDIEKIKALEDNILEQYNKNVELANKMKQETEKFAKQANTAIEDYNSNAETKAEEFNTNAKEKTDEFNSNATEKKTEISDIADVFDANVEEKTNTFNSNVETKTTEFNNNSNTKTEEFNNNSTEKINAFNSNAEEKIADYNEHVETLTSRIADLEEETDDLFNALDTEKISGTELYIEDAKPCRIINTEISGMYKQETTKGTNIMNLNVAQSSKVTVNEDGTVTINGAGGFGLNFESFTVKANIPYYIKWEIVSGNIPTNLSLVFFSSTNSKWLIKDIFNTLTPKEDKEISSFWIHQNAKFENAKIRIWIGESQSDFEPYTGKIPSPSPDYLQEIGQVESVKLEICNQNLFDGEFRQGGINSLNTLNRCFSKNNIYIETGNYLVITDLDVSVYNYGILVSDTKFPTTVQNFSYDSSWKKEGKFVFSIIKSGNLGINLRKNDNSNITLNMINDIKFAIFKLNPINIDLKGNKLCAISDTIKDKLLIDRNGNVALQKNVLEGIITGNLNVKVYLVDDSSYAIFQSGNEFQNFKAKSHLISNMLIQPNVIGTGWNLKKENIDVGTSSYNRIQVKLAVTRLESADLAGLNKYLSDSNIIFYYEAKDPELIDLGQLTELLKTFNGINNIWAETNLGNTEIEIEYVQDIKKLLEQQNARLDNIEALLSTTQTSALLLDNMQTDLESEVE